MSLRVVPFGAGLHNGMMSGPFVILRFPLNGDGRESEPPRCTWTASPEPSTWTKPNEVDRYAQAFESIWAAALTSDVPDLILQAARELAK